VTALQAEVDTNATISHAVYNVGYTSGSSATVSFVPFNGNSEHGGGTFGTIPSGASERVSFIAPYAGKIIRVGWRSEITQSSGSGNSLMISLCEAGHGVEVPSVSGTVGTPYERTAILEDDTTDFHNPTDWLLYGGRTYALRVAARSAPIDSIMTVVIEYTI